MIIPAERDSPALSIMRAVSRRAVILQTNMLFVNVWSICAFPSRQNNNSRPKNHRRGRSLVVVHRYSHYSAFATYSESHQRVHVLWLAGAPSSWHCGGGVWKLKAPYQSCLSTSPTCHQSNMAVYHASFRHSRIQRATDVRRRCD